MEKKRFKYVIPMMVIVAISATFMLNKYHTAVPMSSRVYIIIGATLFAGIISYFLFPQASENKADDYWPGQENSPYAGAKQQLKLDPKKAQPKKKKKK